MDKSNKKEFLEALFAVKTEKELESFLHAMLTPQEIDDLPKRMAIFKMLAQGVPHHTIAKRLKVGVATVTRGSQEMQRGNIQKTAWWQNLASQLRG